MKKLLFLVTALLISASFAIGQDQITLGLGDVDLTGYTVGQEVLVPVVIVSKTPGYDVIGFDFFIEFDHTYLQWLGTPGTGLNGFTGLNPLFGAYSTGDWTWNDNEIALISLWQDPTYMGINFPDGAIVFNARFSYKGGLDPGMTSPLTWQTAKQLAGTTEIKLEKGITNVFNNFFVPFTIVNKNPGSIYVAGGVTPPVADFIGAPLTGVAPLTVNFTDLSTNTPTSWAWDFGDAGTSTLQNPSHIYGAGTWTVSLTATNAGGSNTMTKVGYIVVTEPCVPGTWTGLVSSDWFDGGNWSCGTVPVGIAVTIPAGTPNDPVILTNDVTPDVAFVTNMTNNASVTIGPLGYLTVSGTLANNGSVLMLTDAANQASLICSSFAGPGAYEYDRYLGVNMGLPGEERGWHYISSPVPGFGSWNMFDYFLNTWDEASSLWVPSAGMQYPDCTPATQIFNNGTEGWSVKIDELYTANPPYNCSSVNPGTGMTVEYLGTPNAGLKTKAMTYTGVGLYPGFNLVGNPYPSYWNYDSWVLGGSWPAGVNDAIYYWDESINQYASYIWPNSTNGGGPYVPPAQGFFLELDGSEPIVNVTFNDVDRVHVINLPYYKNTENVVKLLATANGYTDETVIHFDENMTINRDKKDARKLLSGGSTVPSMYTMAGSDLLSINGMPATDAVPVYFSCQTSGTYSIEALETSEFANVVLEDLLTGEQTDLLVSGHSFSYTVGENAGRFILHFTPMGTPELSANSINIWAANQTIYVQTPAMNGDIVVFNLMGQEVVRTAIVPGLNQIPMKEVNTYFIVKVLGSELTETGKVFIK
jgi:PKD repeat protein